MSLGRLATFVVLLSMWATPAGADVNRDGGPGPRRVTEGALLWRAASQPTPTPAPSLATDVDLRVTGLVVRASVRQQFSNPSAEWAEGVYVFPLPEDAAVDRLKMRVGDRVVEGVIRERVAARTAYEQARQQGRRTSLVEQERPNVFTASVANIPPGAAITVEIEYQQAVRYDAGRFRLRFPMVVGPRYSPGTDTDAVPDASRITPPVRHPSEGPINPVTLRVELDPGVPLAGVESPYHAIHTTALRDGRYEVALQQGSVAADRDFELAWEPVAGAAPAAAARERLPREAVFVLDHSGSMAGASIAQARAALKLALARLRPTDTFNVIRFNHRTDGLFPEARPATPQNLGAAERYVEALRADGGTEILPALARALDGGERPGRVRQVIFLTDGAVGNEPRLFEAIRERLGDSRLFTIGIGSAPNSHFMREAARLGRGTFTHVGSPTEVQQRMTELFRKLESPALADLRLELPGAGDPEILPHPLPDLYAGEPVVVALRARTLPTHAVLRGRSGTTAWESEVPLRDSAPGAGLAVHWARAKIGALLDQRRAGAADGDVRDAVIEVALRHQLVSAYTSLVAVDVTPARPADAPLTSHALATNLPHGWEYDAVLGAGQGATAAPLHLVIGLAALAIAAALRSWLGRGDALAPARHRHGA